MRALDLSISRVLGIAGLLLGAMWVAAETSGSEAPAMWWIIGNAAVLVMFTLVVAVPAWPRGPSGYPVLWTVTPAVGVTMQLWTYVAIPTWTADEWWEPTWTFSGVYLCLLALRFPNGRDMVRTNLLAAALALAPATAHLLRFHEFDLRILMITAVQFSNVVVSILLILFRRRMIAYLTLQDRRQTRASQADTAAARVGSERELARIAHDKVLGALNVAAMWTGPLPDEIVRQASEARDAIVAQWHERPDESTESVARDLKLLALEIDPDCTVDLRAKTGSVPSEAARALREATGEALRNSVRHAPGSARVVHGTVSPISIQLTVYDDGPGITGTPTMDRLGIRDSISGRMRDLAGGSAEIVRVGGFPDMETAGAAVRLSWASASLTRRRASAEPTSATTPRRTLRVHHTARGPLAWVLLVALFPAIVGALLKGSFSRPDAWLLGVSIFGALWGAAVILAPRSLRQLLRRGAKREEVLLLVGIAMTSAILCWFGTPAWEPALFTAAIGLATVAMFFGHAWSGLAAAIGLLAIRSAVAAAADPQASVTTIVDLYSTVIVIVAAIWVVYSRRLTEQERILRAASRDAFLELSRQERALAALRMNDAIAASGAATVIDQIVGSQTMTEPLRHDVRVAEASLRDRLRCPGLLHPTLVSAVLSARQGGATVLLLGGGYDTDPTGEILISDHLADILATQLSAAGDGDSITIRKLPGNEIRYLTLMTTHADGSDTLSVYDHDGRSQL